MLHVLCVTSDLDEDGVVIEVGEVGEVVSRLAPRTSTAGASPSTHLP